MPDTAPITAGGPRQPRIAIVGGGLSGIVGGAMLKRNNLDNFVIFEKYEQLGGTWYMNKYPALSCDVPAFAYQVSFEQNPRWSCPYPPRDELLQYCIDLGEKYGLYRHARFNQDVTKYVWNEDRSTWTLSISESDGLENLGASLPEEEFDIVLNYRKAAFAPSLPDIAGAKEGMFRGEAFHSMDWPIGGLAKLAGKRVAVVGLAAAAVQIIGAIAKHTKSLTIYSRTANYVSPKPNDAYSEEQKEAWAKDPVSYRLHCAKASTEFFSKWHGPMFHPGTPAALEQTKVCLDHLAEKVKDPKLRELLTPNYPMWARRTLYTNDFYPTLALPHVELVAEKILRIEADGIVSSTAQAKMVHNAGVGYSVEEPIDAAAPTKKREIDVIIWATGFNFMNASPEIVGRNGVTATDLFMRDGEPMMYQGGFQEAAPNFINGCSPCWNQSATSFITNIEICMKQALDVIHKMINENLKSFEVKREAVERWDALMDEQSKSAVFGAEGAFHSYYKVFRAKPKVGQRPYKTFLFFPGTGEEMAAIFAKLIEDDFIFESAAGEKRFCYGDSALISKELKECASKVKFGGVYKGPGCDADVL